jgi:multicomponent Na+:H+ antiporter subunit B
MKWSALLGLLFAGALLVYSAPDLPALGQVDSPPSQRVSPRFIEQGPEETAAPNMVTGVIADYRSFDTLFEGVVILIAGLATALVLWPEHREKQG